MARQPFFGRGPAPQIARMDTQAATAPGRNWGAAFESIGQTVGDTLEKFRADKEKKKQQTILGDTVFNQFKDNPEAIGAADEEELRAITNSLGKNPDALNFVTQFRRDAQTARMNEQLIQQRGRLIDSLENEKVNTENLNRFLYQDRTPEVELAESQEGPVPIYKMPGKFAERVKASDSGYSPAGPTINVATGEIDPRTIPAPQAAQPLPERFQALLNSDLSPEAKAQGLAAIKAEAAALAGPEQELDREMRLAAYKDQLGGATGPIDTTASDVTNDAIGRALPLIGDFTTGFGSYLKGIPGTEAKTLDRLLATVRANVGFEKLQAMRKASPTGGALGNVSDKEIQFLQAVLGDLDQANDDVELKYNLKLVQHMFNNIVHGKGNHSFRHPGDPTEAGGQPPAGGATPADIEALRQQIIRKTALGEARATERRESAERLHDQAPDLPPSTDPLIEDLRRQQGADAFRAPMGSPGLPPSTPQPPKPIDEVLKDVDTLIQSFGPGQ